METFFASHYRECLAAGVIVGRLADIGSTWLASPKLLLEANPLVRRFRWPFGFASLALCVLPYTVDWGWAMAIPVIVMSLLVSSANFKIVLGARTLGEEEYLAHVLRVYARASRPLAYTLVAVASAPILAAAALLILFYPSSQEPAYHFGLGIGVYGLAIAIHGTVATRRMFRQAGERAAMQSAAVAPVTRPVGLPS